MKEKKSTKKSKAQTLIDKKEKARKREENLKTLKDCALDQKLSEVLISSKDFGILPVKDHLSLELKREKLGLSFDPELHQSLKDTSEGPIITKFPKVPIYIPKSEFESESEEPVQVFQAPPLRMTANSTKPPINPEVNPYIPTEMPSIDPSILMGYSEGRENLNQLESQANIEDSLMESLPILQMEQEIIETIKQHPVTIICGETGCGKSTQLPRFLHENGFTSTGKVGITQPRRIAAVTLAKRVSEEMSLALGREVGYQVRYDNSTVSNKNKIKFMTDGILLKEMSSDFLLNDYSVIIIDEAHERGINTDILIALLSRVVRMRTEKPLKLVIMSATIRVEDFTSNPRLFESPPVIRIDSRQYPVSLHFAKVTNTEDFLDQCFAKVKKIHNSLPPGGILVFVPGKKDVLALKSRLKDALPSHEVSVQGLYSMLPLSKQVKIFSPAKDKRLVVISTNVAETSITIPGVVYVVDSGLEKRKVFSAHLQMSKFIVTFTSQASASQRAGRAGRTGPGHCYRLYSSAAFYNVFTPFRDADICSFPLTSTVLQLKALGVKNVIKFPFPTPPDQNVLIKALEELAQLGALDQCRNGNGDVFQINECGRKLARLPIAPRFSKMVLMGQEVQVLAEISIVVAVMEVDQIFDDLAGAKKGNLEGKKKRSAWFKGKSDLLCALRMIIDALRAEDLVQFCSEFGVLSKSLNEVIDLAEQVFSLASDSTESLKDLKLVHPSSEKEVKIQKAIVSGLIDQVCIKAFAPSDQKITRHVAFLSSKPVDATMFSEEYKALEVNKEYVFIHPSSYFFSRSPPDFIAYQHLVFTQRPSVINITEVQVEWLYELGTFLIHDPKPESDAFALYDSKNDWIMTRVIAGYGKANWKLPPTLAQYPDCEMLYFHTAKFLMDGSFFGNNDINRFWKVKINKFSGKLVARVQKNLKKHMVKNLATLIQVVRGNQQFLIKSLVDCAKDEFLDEVNQFWKIVNIL